MGAKELVKIKFSPPQSQLGKYLEIELKRSKSCLKCSQPLGFLSQWLLGRRYFCKDCYQEILSELNQGLNRYAEYLQKAIRDGKLSPSEEKKLKEIQEKYKLTKEAVKLASTNAYFKVYQEVISDRKVTDEELEQINELRRKLELAEEEISPTLQTLAKLRFLTQLEEGILPEIETDIFLRKKEVAHYQTFAELYEERVKKEYVGGHSGFSIRIAKGVYWRVGGFKGRPIERTIITQIDQGKLVVTNKRLVFSGERKSFSVPFSRLIDLELFKDAVKINREGKVKKEYFVVRDPEILAKIITLAVNQ